MKDIIDKLDFSNIKNFSVKDNIKRIRWQTSVGENIFAKETPDKELYPKYTKNPWNSTIRK